MRRYQLNQILNDLKKKMVILVGPRQVGKTWLAREIMTYYKRPQYLNYDAISDRSIITSETWSSETDLLVLDELHKMPNWKQTLKGIYDTKPSTLHILITGSARLDTYNHMSESLAGRFFRHRLTPLSPSELHKVKEPVDIKKLIYRGGFPESYLAETDEEADRWRSHYIGGLITEDALQFNTISNINTMKLLVELLRTRVGSPTSYMSLARDLNTSSHTIKKYIEILEALFIIFRITPWSRNIARSLLKEPKLYFYDTGMVLNGEGAMFENLIAMSYLTSCFATSDYLGKDCNLHYIRTKDGKEIDFCITESNIPTTIIEAKLNDPTPSAFLHKTSQALNVETIQLVKELKHEQDVKKVKIRQAETYLTSLFL